MEHVKKTLRASSATAESMLSSSYWSALCPFLHVDGTYKAPLKDAWVQSSNTTTTTTTTGCHDTEGIQFEGGTAVSKHISVAKEHLRYQGFLKLLPAASVVDTPHSSSATPTSSSSSTSTSSLPPVVWPPGLIENLKRGVLRLVAAGHDASCILAYDEVWFLQAALAECMSQLTDGNKPLGDFYVFCVAPPARPEKKMNAGFKRRSKEVEEEEAKEGLDHQGAGGDAGTGSDDDDSDDDSSGDDESDDNDDDDDDDDAPSSTNVASGAHKAWTPHRDRPMQDATRKTIEASFRAAPSSSTGIRGAGAEQQHNTGSGYTRYNTVWVPLTPATCESSCLYMIPAPLDPSYLEGDATGSAEDPFAAAIQSPKDYQKIIALPFQHPGGVLTFSHRTLHWGSSPLAPVPGEPPQPPRIAISLAYVDPEWETPYLHFLNKTNFTPSSSSLSSSSSALSLSSSAVYPPLEARMGLVAAQAITYDHQVPLSRRKAKLYTELFSLTSDEYFDETYSEKVMATARWSRFKKKANEQGGVNSLRRSGAPTQEDIDLLFCALASARMGLDCEAYL